MTFHARALLLLALALLIAPTVSQRFPSRILQGADNGSIEGNSASSYPFGQRGPSRVMQAYGADMLGSTDPVRVTGVEFRLDRSTLVLATSRVTFTLDVSTSVNPADRLDRRFDNNHGADKTRAAIGTYGIVTPRYGSFVLSIRFSTPFTWDPRFGPLLLDFRYQGSDRTSRRAESWDGQTDGRSTFGRIMHRGDADAAVADWPATGTERFAFVTSLVLEATTLPFSGVTEGDASVAFPGRGPLRLQYVYDTPRIQISNLGRYRIQSLSFRTDRRQPFPGSAYTMRVTLSTGVPELADSMTSSFADNRGNDAKVVFDGEWRPAVSTPPATAPVSPFAQELVLQEPFDYDPDAGSLVMEIQLFQVSGSAPLFDAERWPNTETGLLLNHSDPHGTTGAITRGFSVITRLGVLPMPVLLANPRASSTGGRVWGRGANREMFAYDGGLLALGQPVKITHLRWNSVLSQTSFGPATYDARISLSTGSRPVNQLSTRFATNHGLDYTRVFDGEISLPFGARADIDQFYFGVELDRPFHWDPGRGPLIIDIQRPNDLPTGMRGQSNGRAGGPGVRTFTSRDPFATVASADLRDWAMAVRIAGFGKNGLAIPYGTACGPQGQPYNSTLGLPETGNDTFGFTLHQSAASQPCALLIGTARQQLNLGFLGLPACDLLVDPNLAAIALRTDVTGAASLSSPIPPDARYDGAQLFTQWYCVDPRAIGGATTSPGLRLVIRH